MGQFRCPGPSGYAVEVVSGTGLGTVWGEGLAREILRAAGFRTVDVHRIPTDAFNSYDVCRK